MPKQPLQEIFSQGLVTSRPSHMLSSGEVVRADHTVYRENSASLQRAPDHGYYSEDNLLTYGTYSPVTGILMGNFDAEEYPDQLIVRAGHDLYSSNITGPSNNTFQPVTFPGRVIGDFDETPTALLSVDYEDTVVYPATAGLFDGKAFVGRAIWSETAFPIGQGTIIKAVTTSEGSITSFTVNIPAAATIESETVHFAPECTLAGLVYADSIGFTALPADTAVMTNSPLITSCNKGNSGSYSIAPPTGSQSAFNLYAQVGRKVTVEDPNEEFHTSFKLAPRSILITNMTRYETATILKVTVSDGKVTEVFLDREVQWVTNSNDLQVRFLNYTSNIAITAVGDLAESDTTNPVYSSCYFDWFPQKGQKTLIFSGGLARGFPNEDALQFDGLSWDGSMFVWDGKNLTHRLEYRNRRSFDPENQKTRAIVARPAGLLPVIDSPTIVVKNDGSELNGAWNPNLATGIYWLLITEAYIPTKNQLDEVFNPLLSGNLLESSYLASNNITGESVGGGLIVTETVDGVTTRTLNENYAPAVADAAGHAGRPIPFRIGDVKTDYVQLTLPAPRNDGKNGYVATHWCVYIAGAGESYTSPPPFSSFTRTHCATMTRYSAGQVIELKDYQATQSFLDETLTFAPVPVKEFKDYTFEGPLFDPNSSTRGGYTGDPQRPLPIRAGQPGEVIFWRSWAGEEKKDLPGFFAHGDWVLPGAGNGIFAGKALSGIRVSIDIQYQGTHKPGDSNLAWFTLDVGTLSSLNYKYAPIKQSEDGFKHYGGPNDTWGLDSTTADLGTLRVRITKCTSGGWSQINFYNPKVVVYYTTTSINFNGPAYRSVTYRSQVGGADISDPSQLPPPKATMGDTFQGSLVLNDVTAPSFIRYSLPDQPERFPAPYRMKMGTRRKGKITALKAYKQVLIVGMERAVKRVNYLPKEVDTDFVQGAGLSHEDISATHGIVGPNAITDFDMPGMGPVVAYVSTIGLRVTNGVDSRALNTDVLLKDYVHPDYWSKCILRAFPNQKWLILYYVPKGSSHGVLSKCLVYSYSEDHIKGGATIVLSGNPPLTGPLPVTGPCDCYVVDACDIVINSSPQVATTDGEYIFIEDSAESETPIRTVTGDDDATKVQRVNVPNIKSRDLFPAGFTQDSNIGSVYLIHETKGSQFVATGATSTKDSTVLYFNTGWGAHTPQVGERVIHGGWDSPPSVLAVGETDVTLSAPAVRAFTGDATFDTGVILVRVNAAQFGEDEVPILTEYRSTSVGVGQAFLMDATANRFSVEIIKTENPNTGDLNDLGEDMSIIGIVYHAASTGETTLHAN